MPIYTFSKNNKEKYFLDITIKCQLNGQNETTFQLPSWRPGRYELQNFSKHVRDFTAFNENGDTISYTKQNKDTWLVNTKGLKEVTARYSYFARQMDAGGSWVDDTQWYINFINCAMLVNQNYQEVCEIKLNLPPDWQIAGSLKQQSNSKLQASNYYELVDSPIIASPTLQCITYQSAGTDFYLWFQGQLKIDESKLLDDFRKFTDTQIALFGSFPTNSYHFLFQILPYEHYHGVEHANSTVITLGPDYAFYTKKLYDDFLGVSSHELFHTWNITRLRPVEMTPYHFFQENYFHTGFIAEGITTYYGDYLLKRSGVFSMKQYLKELNKILQRHFNNSGRNHASLADSSMDLWLDGYKKGIPGRKVSIYIKGALTALILDLSLRFNTKGKASLDDVMRLMWHKYSMNGYSFEQYKVVVNEVAGQDMNSYFSQYISGKEPLEAILAELLPKFGLQFTKIEAKNAEEKYFGLKLQYAQGKLKVMDIAEDSPAMEYLEVGDELIALNKAKPADSFQYLFENSSEIQIHYFFNNQLKEATLRRGKTTFFNSYEVLEDTSAETAAIKYREQWLGETE